MCIMNNKILLLAATALLAFACGKTDYPEYEWGPQDDTTVVKTEVFFVKTADILELDPVIDTVTVTLGRTVTTEALTVPLIVKDPAGIFVVPSAAEFEAGAATTTIDIDISKMELEKNYELSISLPSDFFYTYKKTSGAASAQTSYHMNALKQKWNDAGTCTFYDGTWYDSVVFAENVAIQNHEGTDDYRIVAPYAAIDPDDWPAGNITFSLVANKKGIHEFKLADGIYDFWPGVGYYVYWNTAKYDTYCYVDHYKNDDGVDTFEFNTLLTPNGKNLYTGGWFAWEWNDYPFADELNETEEAAQ